MVDILGRSGPFMVMTSKDLGKLAAKMILEQDPYDPAYHHTHVSHMTQIEG
jgi:hypothetical protein